MAQIKSWDYDLAGHDVSKMKKLYAYWKKVANERIKVTTKPKNIEHAQAYKHIVEPLKGSDYIGERHGMVVFKALPKNATPRHIREAFRKLTDFLQAKTSTVAGIKEVAQERINNIKEMTGGSLSSADAESLLIFLGSPEGVEAKSQYDSDLVVQAISLDLNPIKKPGEDKDKKDNIIGGRGSILERWQSWKASGKTLADWIRQNGGQKNGQNF